MIAVINHLHFVDSVEKYAEKLNSEGMQILAALPGFLNLYFVKEGENSGVVILLWDSPEHAKNGADQFGPTWFAKNIAPNLASEQRRSVGPVLVKYEPAFG